MVQQKQSKYSRKYKRESSKGRPGRAPREKYKNCRVPGCLGRRRREEQDRRPPTPSRITNRRLEGEEALADSNTTSDSLSVGKMDSDQAAT